MRLCAASRHWFVVLEVAGGTLKDVTYNEIFLKDLADYKAMNGSRTILPEESAGSLMHLGRPGETGISG